ncbi:MAG TPA: DUF4157 domain-containing protein [Dehalococcoidia bacterium]|nr:DUF4157 domain-containing protein [Dehalococcoidia bacterium]
MAVQAKLTVNAPNDIYEQEADRVADMVTSTVTNQAQRQAEEEEEEEPIQAQAVGSEPAVVAERLERQINTARGGGHPLDGPVQASLEPHFGADFSSVRVHTDSEADALNRSLSARAFTTGTDIFFRKGAYDPASISGQRLIAHELSHVVQQSSGRVGRSGTTLDSPKGIQMLPSRLTPNRGGQIIQRDLTPDELDTLGISLGQYQAFKPMDRTLIESWLRAGNVVSAQQLAQATAKVTAGPSAPAAVAAPPAAAGGGGKPARLHIHADIEAESMGIRELKNGEVGHAWVSLEWKDPAAVPPDIHPDHEGFLARGGMFADPMGFWPKIWDTYDALNDEWAGLPEDQRVGYSTNIFKSYVEGQMLHPDNLHTPRATQSWDITRGEADNVIDYAESKRNAKYSVYFYNCTTFAGEAVKAAGKKPPSMSTLGICYPNKLYEGIKKNQSKFIGTTEVTYYAGQAPVRVEGVESVPKKR